MTEPRHGTTSPKLIIVTHEFEPYRGGVATYTEELAAAVHRAGHAVEVWAPDYGDTKSVNFSSFPVVRLRSGGSLGLWDTIQFARQLIARRESLQPASVLLGSVGAHMAFLLLAPFGLVKCRRILSLLHGSEVLRFQRNPFWRALARRFFPRVEQVLTVSAFSKSLIEKSFLSPLARTILIAPCACSTAAARSVPATRMVGNKIRILTLARVHPRKGQLDTARALALVPSSHRKDFVYLVGGQGDRDYLRQIERACRESGIEFQYLGLVDPDQLAATYQHCDIYAMTSRTLPRSVEGFGITYLDAGFHGKPVVAYNSGGTSEAVVDNETGLLVEEGNLQALSKAFVRLISEPDLRKRLGEGGRKHTARFSWDATARGLLARDFV